MYLSQALWTNRPSLLLPGIFICYSVPNYLVTTHLVETCFNRHESVLFMLTHCIVTHYTYCIIKNAETYLHLDIVKSAVMTGLKSVLNEQSS